jgi:hypothetical protein
MAATPSGSSGLERRAQIDADTVKALLLTNGGGAVALLGFVPAIIGRPELAPLASAALVGLVVLMFGLTAAIVHNICRRKCALVWEQHGWKPPKGTFLGITLWEPRICAVSTVCKWVSLAAFLSAGAYVATVGISTLSTISHIGTDSTKKALTKAERTLNDKDQQALDRCLVFQGGNKNFCEALLREHIRSEGRSP